MVSFEELNSILGSQEKILWKQETHVNQLKELKFVLSILIYTVFISTFSLLLYFFTTPIEVDGTLSFLIILSILLISAFPLYLFFRIYSEYKKLIKKLDVKISELRRYEEFYILTNKRWIQKSFYLAKTEDFKSVNDEIIKESDIAYLNLDNIKVVYLSPQKKEKGYLVNLFRKWDGKVEESFVHFIQNKTDLKKLMEFLQIIFQITKEERNVIKNGDFAIHVNRKKEI